jgi:Ca2+-binding RTX toxin-like protein
MSQYPAVISLDEIDGSNGFVIHQAQDGDLLGGAVASAGDVNGDGYDDVILGAPQGDDGAGAGYVVFGSASGPASVDLAALDGSDGFSLHGVNAKDIAGHSVASAGDFNGDGIDDLVIGAPQAGGDDYDYGATYVVYGTTAGFDAAIDLADLDGADGFKLVGFGLSGDIVGSAGDVNGDGFDDLIISTQAGGPGYGAAAYVVFGAASGFDASFDLTSLNGTNGFRVVQPSYYSDWVVASAGDVNGDGFDDVLIGSHHNSEVTDSGGSSYVVFGKASGFDADFQLSSLDGSNGFRINGTVVGALSGYSVASAGDINGDGLADLLIGAPHADYETGAAYVVFGRKAGFDAAVDLGHMSSKTGFRLDGLGTSRFSYSDAGLTVASAGDVNGDGFDDMIIGGPNAETDTGSAAVVFGHAGGFGRHFAFGELDGSNGFRIDGIASGDKAGSAVASAGDVNGDGLDDLIVGVGGAGESYVLYGRLPDAAVVRIGAKASQTLVGGDFNDSLSGMKGDDALWGHGGRDIMTGGAGADTLVGGAGKDLLTGSAGRDVFVYAHLSDSGGAARDTIADFVRHSDLIDLHLIDANADLDGDQAFTLVEKHFHGAAGELLVRTVGGDTLVQGDIDGDKAADFAVVLTGHLDLKAADFVL